MLAALADIGNRGLSFIVKSFSSSEKRPRVRRTHFASHRSA